jgi:hypothetical protein
MATVTGVVERYIPSNKYGKSSLQVNGNWYNTKPEWLGAVVAEGNSVTFDDGGKNYIKSLKVVDSTVAPALTRKNTNIGVELGHASKLALDICCASGTALLPGSDEWYKKWMTHTERVYRYMTKMKEVIGDGGTLTPEETSGEIEVTLPPEMDVFDRA